jgi:hypothetical protein
MHQGAMVLSTGKRSADGETVIDGEYELLELILSLGGANYFDEHRNSPFKYALLLFACHRFGDAIVYLWQADKVFFAVHLTVLCLHYGLILPHMTLHQNPVLPLVSSYYQTNVHDTAAFGHAMMVASSSSSSGANPIDGAHVHAHGGAGHAFSLTPRTVLTCFLENEQLRQSAQSCLAYWMSLNSNWLKHAQIPYQSPFDKEYRDSHRMKSHETVSSTLENFLMTLSLKDLNEIVGYLEDANTIRMKLNTVRGAGTTSLTAFSVHSHGLLEQFIPDTRDIDTHLSNIARKFLVQHRDAESAKYFFTLAGKWKDVVEVLNEELMSNLKLAFTTCLAPSSSSVSTMLSAAASSRDQSAFWFKEAETFVRDYIQMDHSAVADLIAKDGHRESLDFLMILMQLYYFFVAFRQENDPLKALVIMDGIEIVPSLEEHLRSINPIHPKFRSIMDDLLMVLSEIIRAGFQVIKSQMPPAGANSFLAEREAALQAMRLRSRVLSKYVQMVKSQLVKANTTIQYISRLDTLLI